MASAAVLAVQHFPRKVDDWKGLQASARTWSAWKTTFQLAHLKRQMQILATKGAGQGGLANVVICDSDNSNGLKNNYYYALATDDNDACNPPQHPISHTGIADSGASGFFFTDDATTANRDQHAPTIRVCVANGRAERCIASATLASVPTLPPAAMRGHVMPSLTNSFIGLGPFVDRGHTVVFTATGVSVIHPDGHFILDGWREAAGP
jgi:hypothetical protein